VAPSWPRVGAWAFIAWAAAAVVLVPAIRLVAESHGFFVRRLWLVDLALVAYALVAGFVAFVQLQRGTPPRWLAALALLPLAAYTAGPGGVLKRFILDRSGYPVDLVVVDWLVNLSLLSLAASVVLLLAPRPGDRAPAPV
jgi:hypothetical protein